MGEDLSLHPQYPRKSGLFIVPLVVIVLLVMIMLERVE